MADARGSGPRARKGVEVRILSSAPFSRPGGWHARYGVFGWGHTLDMVCGPRCVSDWQQSVPQPAALGDTQPFASERRGLFRERGNGSEWDAAWELASRGKAGGELAIPPQPAGGNGTVSPKALGEELRMGGQGTGPSRIGLPDL